MLLTNHLLQFFLLHLNVLQLFGKFPYVNDGKKRKLIFCNKNGLKGEHFKHTFLAIISIIITYKLFHYRNSFPNAVIYEEILYTCGLLTFIITVEVYFWKCDNVVELLNLFLRFEQNFLSGKLKQGSPALPNIFD